MMQQGSVSMLPISSATEEAIPREESSQDLTQASGSPEALGGPPIKLADPRNLRATIFALDDAMKGSEWCGLHASMGGVAQLLTCALSTLNGAAPTG
jgi:hypothetical protein